MALGVATHWEHSMFPPPIPRSILVPLAVFGLATMVACPVAIIVVLRLNRLRHRDAFIAVALTLAIEFAQIIAYMPLIQ